MLPQWMFRELEVKDLPMIKKKKPKVGLGMGKKKSYWRAFCEDGVLNVCIYNMFLFNRLVRHGDPKESDVYKPQF